MARRIKNCPDCNKKILEYSQRCQSCAQKERFTRMEIWNKGLPNTWFNPKGLEKGWKLQNRFTKGQVPWNKGKKYLQITGVNHFNWKGGISGINRQLRASLEYEEWRIKVFERDLYTCQSCGQVGGYLQADHIKPFILYPDLRLELSNGQTLCIECHRLKTSKD